MVTHIGDLGLVALWGASLERNDDSTMCFSLSDDPRVRTIEKMRRLVRWVATVGVVSDFLKRRLDVSVGLNEEASLIHSNRPISECIAGASVKLFEYEFRACDATFARLDFEEGPNPGAMSKA